MRALARFLPQLAARVPWASLGVWPTPLTQIDVLGRPIWVKHEGDSHPLYGGNKLRTLEAWFGHAKRRGARRIWAIGAYGSNHALATLLHAPRVGLEGAAMLFPQPSSPWAIENCGAMLAYAAQHGARVLRLRSVVEVPWRALQLARRERDAIVMPPGGATPIGTFGALDAAFELAAQIRDGAAPPPARIVLPIGSACTTSGLLAGLSLAQAIGAWPWPLPIVHGVRVTPWPVTSRLRIANLARATLARVARLGGPVIDVGLRELYARLHVDPRELGPGYGRVTPRATRAILTIKSPRLDGVYAAKAAAAAMRLHRDGVGPLLFWSTKATTLLDAPSHEALRTADPVLVRWLRDSLSAQTATRDP